MCGAPWWCCLVKAGPCQGLLNWLRYLDYWRGLASRSTTWPRLLLSILTTNLGLVMKRRIRDQSTGGPEEEVFNPLGEGSKAFRTIFT